MSYKTLKFVLTVGILLIVIASVLMGCSKPFKGDVENGKLTVEMTAAPGN